MISPIYVLCSNFTEMVYLEVGEKMRCFADKKNCKMRVFFPAPFCTRLAEGAKSRVACHVTLRLPVKFRPNRFRFAAVIPKK